ncbi:MAG: hypothetical protein HN981_03325 [Candidatus Pacebacteria bacterium]|jgi:hypothetical protein|nr:hypothetical protein [Candidatus Paceibacterota bacterium]MBT6921394.1 hypothetical protein [Candidatus Paceibacterota bacterium]
MIESEVAVQIAQALERQTNEVAMAQAYAWELLSADNDDEEKQQLVDELDGCPFVSFEVQQLIDAAR